MRVINAILGEKIVLPDLSKTVVISVDSEQREFFMAKWVQNPNEMYLRVQKGFFWANLEEAPSLPFGDKNITQDYPYAGISWFKHKDEKIKYNLMRENFKRILAIVELLQIKQEYSVYVKLNNWQKLIFLGRTSGGRIKATIPFEGLC